MEDSEAAELETEVEYLPLWTISQQDRDSWPQRVRSKNWQITLEVQNNNSGASFGIKELWKQKSFKTYGAWG